MSHTTLVFQAQRKGVRDETHQNCEIEKKKRKLFLIEVLV